MESWSFHHVKLLLVSTENIHEKHHETEEILGHCSMLLNIEHAICVDLHKTVNCFDAVKNAV